jgi:hypothetical protein
MKRIAVCLIVASCVSCREPSNATVSKCVDQCDNAGDCPGGSGDCLEICESQFDEASRIECVPQYESILNCLDNLETVCDPSPCTTELSQYTLCLGAFCAKDRGFTIGKDSVDPSCPDAQGTGGGG